MKIAVALTGASGPVLGLRLVEELIVHEVYAIVTPDAQDVAEFEGVDLSVLEDLCVKVYDSADFTSPLASSSFRIDAMAVCPTSMKSLSQIAAGNTANLVSRCADGCLKMNWPLVLVPRETPLSLPALRNMAAVKEAGAIVLPPMLSYYHTPKKLEDFTDFVVGKILDALGVENRLYKRWRSK